MVSNTGIMPTDEAVAAHNELKMGKGGMRYIIYKMDEGFKRIVVEKRAPASASWDDLTADLVQVRDDCRYAEFSMTYTLPGGEGRRNKLVFVLWAPGDSKVKPKMLYAASLEGFKRALLGTGLCIHAGNPAALDLDAVLASLIRSR